MRISRKNFSISNSRHADQPAPTHQIDRDASEEDISRQTGTPGADQAGKARRSQPTAERQQRLAEGRDRAADTPQDASCQSHFYLAPNVRFTRTPDRGVKRPSVTVDCANEVIVEDTVPAVEAAPVDHKALAKSGASTEGPTSLCEPGHLELPTLDEPLDEQTPANNTDPSSAHLGFLSDHAFFEFMSDDVLVPQASAKAACETIAEAVRPVGPVFQEVPIPAREAQQPEGILSLYRVVECRASKSSVAAISSTGRIQATPARHQADHKPEAIPGVNGNQGGPVPPRAPISMPSPPSRSLSSSTKALPPIGASKSQPTFPGCYELPSGDLLQQPHDGPGFLMTQEQLERNAGLLESVLEDFKVRGEIINVRPGPVVTLYEFEPAPGIKSSRIVNLADDIARSMSAISARVAVVPGRNVIGIELPNTDRETVFFRELIESNNFRATNCKLALSLGKTIGGEPVVADLAKMPHLLVAGTTGSGKSVAINTMILSLLYRLKPEECRLIMVDPKMLELSIYDDIPHLLTPVVTDPKKAVTALKWAVREMEDRYRKMARLGVRNINGFNQRAAIASHKGEKVVVTVQTGFDRETGEPLYEQQEMDLAPMPYIVIIVDEMADLMMVAGKEIEGTIQRLAQMARAAGIHLIMATQRPSVDVITGTIKANFPTRISFQVTSKIDSRTILGEQGAEQLLGMGDMLHMSGGGRINRVHGAFVSDEEVEQVVAHLKSQGRPTYLETVTAEEEEEPEEEEAVFDKGAIASEDGDDLYDKSVKIVLRDKRCSTSYIQRRLGIGYNRAATLVERMEKDGLVGAPNHVGKREILAGKREQQAEE